MSHLNPNYAKISPKTSGDKHERRAKGKEHGTESLRGVGYQPIRISTKIRYWSLFNFKMEQWRKNPISSTSSIRINVRKQRTKTEAKNNRRFYNFVGNKKQKINKIPKKETYLSYLFLFLNYNPIKLNGLKGYKMLKNNIDLRKTATVDDIISLERKILGIVGIIDSFAVSSEITTDNSPEAFELIRDAIHNTIINVDITLLKERVEYMFEICSEVYHGEVA